MESYIATTSLGDGLETERIFGLVVVHTLFLHAFPSRNTDQYIGEKARIPY